MSWLSRGADDRYARAARTRAEVRRGPLPRPGSPHIDEALAPAHVASQRFGTATVFLLALILLLIGATAYYAQYSGALRWLASALVVAAVALVALRVAGRGARDPVRVSPPGEPRGGSGGSLHGLQRTLARATRGLRYSQLVFEDRMRRAFLEKVRVVRGLPGEVPVNDEGALRRLLGDAELAAFLHRAPGARSLSTATPSLPRGTGLAGGVAALLDRMEAWK